MAPPKITLHELYEFRSQKQKAKLVSFEQVLELCHRRLRTVAQYGGFNTFFEIPGLLVGYPLYNLQECTDYVIKSLRKSGFLVQLLPPPHISVLYINWDPEELKPKSHDVSKKLRLPSPATFPSSPSFPSFPGYRPTLPSMPQMPTVPASYNTGAVMPLTVPKRKLL